MTNWDANPTRAPVKMIVSGKDPCAVYSVGPYLVAVRGATADAHPEVVYQEDSRIMSGVRAQFFQLLVEGIKGMASADIVRLTTFMTGQDLFEDVGAFHKKFELDYYPKTRPRIPDKSTLKFRVDFMQEELSEFSEACQAKNLHDAADALADLAWVVLGTAHTMGLPFEKIWAEVVRANMAKERAAGASDPRSKRAHSLDVVKPEGWKPPNHARALEEAARG